LEPRTFAPRRAGHRAAGRDVAELAFPISALAFYTTAIVGLAVLRFKKTAASGRSVSSSPV